MEIAIIGLGKMGIAMAHSLLRAGHQVIAYNRTRAKAAALASSGATVAGSIADACRAGIVITMLADDAALESAALATDGILASLPSGGVHISCSTISVALADKLTDAHARAGQSFVSAPVSAVQTPPKPPNSPSSPPVKKPPWTAASRSSKPSVPSFSSSATNPPRPTSSSSPAIS